MLTAVKTKQQIGHTHEQSGLRPNGIAVAAVEHVDVAIAFSRNNNRPALVYS